jgi:hypothetical protein
MVATEILQVHISEQAAVAVQVVLVETERQVLDLVPQD